MKATVNVFLLLVCVGLTTMFSVTSASGATRISRESIRPSTIKHRRHSITSVTDHQQLRPTRKTGLDRDLAVVQVPIADDNMSRDETSDVTAEHNQEVQNNHSTSFRKKAANIALRQRYSRVPYEDSSKKREKRSLQDTTEILYKDDDFHDSSNNNEDKNENAAKRGLKSLGFRSDLGKRTGDEKVTSENQNDEDEEFDERKRAKSGFRGDLGKRTSVRGSSGFRGDLGKRPLSTRSLRGLRGDSGRFRYSFGGSSGFRGDLGKRLSWSRGDSQLRRAESNGFRSDLGKRGTFESDNRHSHDSKDLYDTVEALTIDPISEYETPNE